MRIKHFKEYDCIFNNKNNLIKVYENQILICRYKYNKHSKVIREDNLLLDASIEYKYNNFGELVQRNLYGYSLQKFENKKYSDKFIYDPNIHKIISYNDEKFDYDRNGHPIIFRDARLSISSNNLLEQIDNYTFEYDAKNNRTIKRGIESITKFYNINNKLIKQTNETTLKFIYEGATIKGFKLNNNKYLYKKNFNDDVVGICDQNNVLLCRYAYDIFGNHRTIVIDKTNNTLAEINPLRFRSQYFDIETGLYYINGKYYDSEIDTYLN